MVLRPLPSITCGMIGYLLLIPLTARGGDDCGQPTICEGPMACGCADANARGLYGNLFGGGGVFDADPITQTGIAFKTPPLAVRAAGQGSHAGAWLAGVGTGYEWEGWKLGNDPGWALLPAAELEGYYLGTNQTAFLLNPTTRLPLHLFEYHTPINVGVLSANLLLTLHTPGGIHPYGGVGLGTAIVSNHNANSAQLVPAEPGINHFNSNPDATNCALAVTPRAGLRFDLGSSWYAFAEWKLLYVNQANFTFGSTVYPTHVPTTSWSVHYGNLTANMAVLGVGVRF